MTNYISLLRGINVSGKNKISMQDLSNLYASFGFENIVTYIQSGNVIFSTKIKPASKIAGLIETGIKEKFGYTVPVLILDKSEFERIITHNPFLKVKGTDISKLHVTLLSSSPAKDSLKKIITSDEDNDRMVIDGKNIYLLCPNGYGRTKFTNTFFENKLKINATTRNWKTITALYEIISNINMTNKGK